MNIFPQCEKENRKIFFGSLQSHGLLSSEIRLEVQTQVDQYSKLLITVDSDICFQMLMGIRQESTLVPGAC